MRPRRAGWILASTCVVLSAALGVIQCAGLTEVVIVVDADLAIPSQVDQVDVTIDDGQGFDTLRQATLGPGKLSFPLTLGVAAGDNAGATLRVTATAKLGGVEVTHTTVTARMREDESRVVHVSLCGGCGKTGCTLDLGDRLDAWRGRPPAPDQCGQPGYARDGGAEAGVDAGVTDPDPCPGGMIAVSSNGFCVDRTEVTQAAYDAFLNATRGDAAGQRALCGFNASYRGAELPVGCAIPFRPDTTPNLPMTCIDWCDAHAYCKWAGKRLCGRVGTGPTPIAAIYDVANDQWTAACSSGGANDFFYGSAVDLGRCNLGGGPVEEVDRRPACAGGPGSKIVDMIGNVAEFEDACFDEDASTPEQDYCAVRGGAAGYVGDPQREPLARCTHPPDSGIVVRLVRNAGTDDVGFRCCADP